MKNNLHNKNTESIREKLKAIGYCHYRSRITYTEEEYQELMIEFSQLERDPYTSPDNGRYRRYANGIILPWKKNIKIHWIPTKIKERKRLSGYDQGSNNPEHDNLRYFNALSGDMKTNEIINNLILDDFNQTFWAKYNFPIYFGIHFVKLVSTDVNNISKSSPDCFHQDGEPFTFAHLVYRSSNTKGGQNHIASTSARNKSLEDIRKNEILESFYLEEPLETFVVHDPAVTHYVEPIVKSNESEPDAERCIILIDFSSMKQAI